MHNIFSKFCCFASEYVYGTDLHKTTGGRSTKTTKRKMKKYVKKYKDNQNKIKLRMQNGNHRNQAQNILIVTRARSGSSFLGDLLNRYPGTFYNFEPLHFCIRSSSWDSECYLKLITQVLKCAPHNGYFQHVKETAFLFRNVRLWKACQSLWSDKMKCYLPEVFYSTCPVFPIRLTKTIRLSFNEAEPLLMDPEIGKSLKVIYLFRDPRGIYKSLTSLCRSDSTEWDFACSDEAMQKRCNGAALDALAALKIKKTYPGMILK